MCVREMKSEQASNPGGSEGKTEERRFFSLQVWSSGPRRCSQLCGSHNCRNIWISPLPPPPPYTHSLFSCTFLPLQQMSHTIIQFCFLCKKNLCQTLAASESLCSFILKLKISTAQKVTLTWFINIFWGGVVAQLHCCLKCSFYRNSLPVYLISRTNLEIKSDHLENAGASSFRPQLLAHTEQLLQLLC